MGSTTPFSAPAGADPAASPVDVFVSHVEEDAGVALALADALEEAGFSTWCYERDSIPGPSYLLQTAEAIERSRAVVVVISASSLGSNQVTAEVVRAHEAVKPFVPVLVGISHVELGARQPEWREAIGSATAISLPSAGVAAITPRIVNGLKALGIAPGEPRTIPRPQVEPLDLHAASARTTGRLPRRAAPRRTWLVVAVAVAALLLVVAGALVLTGGGERTAGDGTEPTAQPTSSVQPTQEPATEAPPADVRDARTSPVNLSQGPARVSAAQLVTQECPPVGLPGECSTAAAGSRFLVLDLRAWGSGDLVFSEAISMEAFRSYVAFEGRRASPVRTWLLEGSNKGFRVVYAVLPAAAAGKTANLFWPEDTPLRLHLRS